MAARDYIEYHNSLCESLCEPLKPRKSRTKEEQEWLDNYFKKKKHEPVFFRNKTRE